MFFCVKRFWPITRVENNSQEKFTILHVPHMGFLCYSNCDQILLYGRWLESKDEYMYTALWSFDNFCCWSQSEVSTDKRKASTFFAFQHVRCRSVLSFLSRPFPKVKILKEVRLSENSLILLEFQFVWNNWGQKHWLSIDVSCPVSCQFFLCCAQSMNKLGTLSGQNLFHIHNNS